MSGLHLTQFGRSPAGVGDAEPCKELCSADNKEKTNKNPKKRFHSDFLK